MMTSQILKPVDFIKTQKSRYLENKTLFFLQIKKHKLHIKGYFIAKSSFVAEVTFKNNRQKLIQMKLATTPGFTFLEKFPDAANNRVVIYNLCFIFRHYI